MSTMINASTADRTAIYGVCPYDDDSGHEFTVMAEIERGHPVIHLECLDDTIRMTPEQWGHVSAAVERALSFVSVLGDDR